LEGKDFEDFEKHDLNTIASQCNCKLTHLQNLISVQNKKTLENLDLKNERLIKETKKLKEVDCLTSDSTLKSLLVSIFKFFFSFSN
jgi:hypothetical protein